MAETYYCGIAVLLFFAIGVDSIVCLFKKIEYGTWAAKVKSLSPKAKTSVFSCIFWCLVLSLSLTAIFFRYLDTRQFFSFTIFIPVAYGTYRLLMTISDREASKHTSPYRPRKDARARRYFSLAFAIFAFSAAAIATFFLGKILPKF